MDSPNCYICTEKFNRSNRIEINCEYCDFTACRTCFESYLLTQSTPHCMKPLAECGKIWTRKFLANNFTITFITKKYKHHQEKILFEKELALMPQTQILIERQNERERKLIECTNEISSINSLINELIMNRNRLEDKKHHLLQRVDIDEYEEDWQETKTSLDKKEKSHKFTFKCSNENCRGFLSSRWKCNLCETWTCSDCRVNVGSLENKEAHVCNKDDLETAKLLKKDSKPCPKCGIIIFKISGCDQMYCTQCNTPFSWNTGEIVVRGHIHNPHYFEYVRNNNGVVQRNPLDVQCGRFLDENFIYDLARLLIYLEPDFVINEGMDIILEICRNVGHLDVHINRIRFAIENYDNNSQKDRIRYLKNYLTEEEFKKTILMNEKKFQKSQEMMNLFVMVRDIGTDILYICLDKLRNIDGELKFIRNNRKVHYRINEADKIKINEALLIYDISIEKILNEFSNLKNYANTCLVDISKTFHTTQKEFTNEFILTNKKKVTKKEQKQNEEEEEEEQFYTPNLKKSEHDEEEEFDFQIKNTTYNL